MTLYRKPSQPFLPGELRVKSWRTLEPYTAENDPTWLARCQQYWTLQARLYGVVLSPFVMLVNSQDGFVSTYSTVMELLPGERTSDYSRVPVAAQEVPRLVQ